MVAHNDVLAAFRHQVDWCEQLGSAFTARLLRILADDIEAGGPVAALISGFDEEPVAAALALRVAGAFHARALEEADARLVALYDKAATDGGVHVGDMEMRSILLDDLVGASEHYQTYLKSAPQTNEVGRSAVLMAGYLMIADRFSLPLDIAEIGASAGLNLGFDQFSYRLGVLETGTSGSGVRLAPVWTGGTPPSACVSVRHRRGCDIAPMDASDARDRLRLQSYVWPDQPERLARLRGALQIARELAISVERMSADVFVEDVLSQRQPGAVQVIAHTIMWQYMPEPMRGHIARMIEVAGASASEEAPLAWLRFEPLDVKDVPTLSLTMWPGGDRQDLAQAHPHGREVNWVARPTGPSGKSGRDVS